MPPVAFAFSSSAGPVSVGDGVWAMIQHPTKWPPASAWSPVLPLLRGPAFIGSVAAGGA